MNHKPYPKYKDSGVEWLGEVPEHWEVKKLGRLCSRIGSGKTPSGGAEVYSDSGVMFLRSQNIQDNGMELSDVAFIAPEIDAEMAWSRVQPGDILINITGASIGRTCLVPEVFPQANVNQHVCAIRLIDQSLRHFVSVQLQSYYFKRLIEAIQDGGNRDSLNFDQISSFKILTAPKTDLESIAAFLDRETSKLDILIREQKELITLLQEKRQALISNAVTKGLNPKAKMKDSGVEWLGEVPEHWDVTYFQRCVSISEGQVDPEDEVYLNMTLIAPNHIESGTGRILELETAAAQGAESGKYFCHSGDVVYSKIRPALRKVCIAPTDCLCSADMYPLTGFNGMSNRFLMWFILSEPFSAFAVLESDRVAMPKINRETLKSLSIPIPPLKEQAVIVGILDRETNKIDTLIQEAEETIDLMHERRASLISEAVTGKIDVRGQA